MPEEEPQLLQDVPAASSPAPDVLAAPSAEPQAPVQTPEGGTPPSTPSQEPAKEPPFHLNPRWQEVQQEKEALRQQNAQLLATLQQVAQAQQPPTQAPQDPYAGMDATTAEFYRGIDKRAEAIAIQKAREMVAPLEQQYHLGRQQLAQVTLGQFYKDNPDVTPNSPEAIAIAQRVGQGYPLEEAKRIVLYDKLQAQLTQKATAQSQHRQAQKTQATPEATAGMPATHGLPATKGTFRDGVRQAMGW